MLLPSEQLGAPASCPRRESTDSEQPTASPRPRRRCPVMHHSRRRPRPRAFYSATTARICCRRSLGGAAARCVLRLNRSNAGPACLDFQHASRCARAQCSKGPARIPGQTYCVTERSGRLGGGRVTGDSRRPPSMPAKRKPGRIASNPSLRYSSQPRAVIHPSLSRSASAPQRRGWAPLSVRAHSASFPAGGQEMDST